MLKTSTLVAAIAIAAPALAQNMNASLDAAEDRVGHDAELIPPPNFQEDFVPVVGDSGMVSAPAGAAGLVPVYAIEAGHAGAPWVRVRFDEVVLSGAARADDGAMLRVTSMADGAVQYLDAVSIRQWNNHTAYFNGDTVLVELLSAPGAGPSRVSIDGVIAGVPIEGEPRSLCGTTDDRVLSSDPRMGRIMPIGCTAWLFNGRSNCMITAGHCGPATNQVIQFNVPLSTGGGTPVAPPPEDQYPVDPASIQSNGGGGVGNDWSTFGVFDNSNTFLSPLKAQGGASFTLADAAPPVAGQTITVTGYGSTSAPVPATWYLVQKTHSGPFTENLGSTLRYAMDTTGGNSGSPVVDETTGLAIGIHTHAGCNTVGGNQGTNINFAPLQAALANPQGVCVPPGISFSYPSGLPGSVDPGGASAFQVALTPDEGISVESSSAALHVVSSTLGETVVPLTEVAPGVFEGAFPPGDCGATVTYYVSASDTMGGDYSDPRQAPDELYSTYAADDIVVSADFDFETAPGWTVTNDPSLTSGAWEIGIPVANGRGDPTSDFDGSGRCFLTQNDAGDSDVDGGPTTLTSPAFDLSGAGDLILSFAAWFSNSSADADRLTIEMSPDGSAWTPVESIASQGDAWFERSYRVADFVALTSGVRVRFSVGDVPNNSVLEAALDDLQIFDVVCNAGCNPSDVAEPFGVLDFSDVTAFLDAFSNEQPLADLAAPAGVFDISDVIAFLDTFVNGCP